MKFEEQVIQGLFGHEAAEDEDPKRLKEYYFKGDSYKQVRAERAVRIVAGHKGIGKSALFKVAIAEDNENGELAVLVQPNDISKLGQTITDQKDFLDRVRVWTSGLSNVVVKKILNFIGVRGKYLKEAMVDFEDYDLKINDFILDYFENAVGKDEYDLSKKRFCREVSAKEKNISLHR